MKRQKETSYFLNKETSNLMGFFVNYMVRNAILLVENGNCSSRDNVNWQDFRGKQKFRGSTPKKFAKIFYSRNYRSSLTGRCNRPEVTRYSR